MSRVSIITPAYNAAPYLAETVKSVQSQTYQDWEMIIVDDCSKDDTYEVAKRFAEEDSRIKVMRNSKNSGVAVTRNNALEVASGEYIAFLDSDDIWLPEKLEKQVDFMDTGQYVLTYTAYQMFDSQTGKKGKIVRPPKTMTAKKIYGDTSIACLTVMVNRNKSGPFSMPLLAHTEDNITWQSILARGYTAYLLDELLALYRQGNQSLTKSKKKAAMQQWSTYRDYYKFSVPKSAFYFIGYAYHAVKKHFL